MVEVAEGGFVVVSHNSWFHPVSWALVLFPWVSRPAIAQPPATSSPSSTVNEFFEYVRQGEYAKAGLLCTLESTEAIELKGLREEQSKAYLFLAALCRPTQEVQIEIDHLDVRDPTATVPIRKRLQREWRMVLRKEDIRWKIDLLATLDLSSPDASTPEVLLQEFERRLRGARASRQLPLVLPSTLEELGLDDAVQGFRNHDFDTVIDVLMLLYTSPTTEIQIGRPEVDGNRAVVSVTKRVDFSGNLVLKKEDGSWRIDLIQSGLRSGYFTEDDARFLHEAAVKQACERHLRRILVGVLMYAKDYDGKLPEADRWMDQLRPYLQDESLYRCPARPEAECGYALNPRWAGKNLRQVPNRARVPLFFETAGSAKGTPGTALPITAPHGGLTLVGFADGHVEWMAPEEARRCLQTAPARSPKLFRFQP